MSEDAHQSGFPPPHHKPSEWPPLVQRHTPDRPWPNASTIPRDQSLALLVFNSGDVRRQFLPAPVPLAIYTAAASREGAPEQAVCLRFERYLHADLARPVYLEDPP